MHSDHHLSQQSILDWVESLYGSDVRIAFSQKLDSVKIENTNQVANLAWEAYVEFHQSNVFKPVLVSTNSKAKIVSN